MTSEFPVAKREQKVKGDKIRNEGKHEQYEQVKCTYNLHYVQEE